MTPKNVFHTFSLAVAILWIAACQKDSDSEYYTSKSTVQEDAFNIQKNVLRECGSSPKVMEIRRYFTTCAPMDSVPSESKVISCIVRGGMLNGAILNDTCPAHAQRYKQTVRASVFFNVNTYFAALGGTDEDVRDPITFESIARLLAAWFEMGGMMYDESYGNRNNITAGSFQADYYELLQRMRSNTSRLVSSTDLSALHQSSAAPESFNSTMSNVQQLQFKAALLEDAPEVAIELAIPYLQGLSEVMALHMQTFDVACKLAKCQPTLDNSRYQVVDLLASFLDRDQLNLSLSKATKVPADIKAFFETVLFYHQKIQSVILSGSAPTFRTLKFFDNDFAQKSWAEKRELIRNFAPGSSDPVLSRFIRISGQFIQHQDNYLALNYYSGGLTNRLEFNPSNQGNDALAKAIELLNSDFEKSLSGLKANRRSLLDAYQNLATLDLKSFQLDADRLTAQLADSINDLEALRLSLSEGTTRRATYLAEAAEVGASQSQNFIIKDTVSRAINADDAMYNDLLESRWLVSDLMRNPITYLNQESTQEILNITVSGSWKPVCALAKSKMANVAGEALTVGPEGYQLSLSSSEANVSSRGSERREVRYQDQGAKAEVCVGGSFGFGSASGCASYSVGKRVEDTSYNSESYTETSQKEAIFQAGIRLPGTPYPRLPAGSLVAAIFDDVNDMVPFKYVVMEKINALTLEPGQKLEFLVNDCKSENSTGQLGIDISARVPSNKMSEKMLKDFAGIFDSDEIESLETQIVQSGPDISANLVNLRSLILKKFALDQAGSLDYRKVPLLNEIMNSWLDQQMLEVKQKHDIRMQERIVRDLDNQYQSLSSRSENRQLAARLQSQEIQLILRDMDVRIVEKNLIRLLAFSESILLPTIELYYPGLDLSASVSELLETPVDATIDQLGSKLSNVFSELSKETLLKNLYRNMGGTQFQDLFIRVPRPEMDVTGSDWPVASNAIRQLIWSYLSEQETGFLKFSIPVEALYQKTIKGRLSCFQALPVIDSAMIGFKLNDSISIQSNTLKELNAGPAPLDLILGPNVQFAKPEGPVNFRLVRGTVNSAEVSQIPVVFSQNFFGLQEELQKIVSSTVSSRAGFGFSPFGDIQLDGLDAVHKSAIAKLGTDEYIEEIVLVYRAKVDSTSTKMKWVSGCN